MDTGAHIGGTANDLKWSRCTHLHLTDTEFVGIGVGLALRHKAHHHPLGLGRQILDGFHLKASQRQPLSQAVWGQRVSGCGDQLLQPLERDPHEP